MTNIELQIDKSFFREEELYGYRVTHQRKEVWAIELDLLHKLDEVCRTNGLKYCVGAGTMLGAVRHKGFIPWDDDIDIYMLRNDYDRLTALKDQFQQPYFLQNSYTEKNLLRSYSRLRNSNTTGCTEMDSYRSINKGIFIDIFPLDGISKNENADKEQAKLNKRFLKLFACYNVKTTVGLPKDIKQLIKLPLKRVVAGLTIQDKIVLFNSYEENIKRFSLESTELWGNRSLNFNCPRTRRPLGDYKDLIYMPFEMLEVPIPKNYDSMLRQQYGDYMKIPDNKGGNMHGGLIISTDYTYDDPRRLIE